MQNHDSANNINLRHLARMENSIEQYSEHLLDLQTLIGELEFIRDSLIGFNESDFTLLNNALMDMESVNCALIEGDEISKEIEALLENSILTCKGWVKKIKLHK